jgi:hypothetical protein
MGSTPTDLAYAAGVIDSDGCIRVTRNTWRMRNADCTTPTYQANVRVKQVERQAVDLLNEMHPGYFRQEPAVAERGRPLWSWAVHSAAAGRFLTDVLPYLRIKRVQADNALEVCRLAQMGTRRFEVPAVVPGEPMVTMAEASRRLGKSYGVVIQAVRKGSVPYVRQGPRQVLIPESYLSVWAGRGHTPSRSDDVLARLEACYRRSRELNTVGV